MRFYKTQYSGFKFFFYKNAWWVFTRPILRRWPLFLLIGFTDPYNHTYSENLWWKLFKNHQRTKIKRQRQWQTQQQRHRKSARNTQLMLYFWNPDDSLIPIMMIDTLPWSSCSRRSPQVFNQALLALSYVWSEQWPRFISNLHLRTSVWYSGDWDG